VILNTVGVREKGSASGSGFSRGGEGSAEGQAHGRRGRMRLVDVLSETSHQWLQLSPDQVLQAAVTLILNTVRVRGGSGIEGQTLPPCLPPPLPACLVGV